MLFVRARQRVNPEFPAARRHCHWRALKRHEYDCYGQIRVKVGTTRREISGTLWGGVDIVDDVSNFGAGSSSDPFAD